MIACTKCKKGKMRTTHTYGCGLQGTIQRTECLHCGAVGIVRAALISIDPPRGEGADAVAKRLRVSPAQVGE